jgi:membrane associated rhomboid family serine protease
MFPVSDADHKVSHFPFINVGLILANIIVFLLQLTALDPATFIYTYALVPSQINFADWNTLYPLITSMFLHGGFLHIIGNMIFLWVFGDNVEDVFGHIGYLAIYLLSGIVGGLAQYMLSPGSDIPMLGASGAVAGALGAYFVFFPNHRIKSFVFIPPFISMVTVSAGFMLGYWIVLQVISSFGLFSSGSAEQGGVAFLAHVAGFAVGYIFAKFVPRKTIPEVVEF